METNYQENGEIKAAIAKSNSELRALHASLSPTPISAYYSHSSAKDYPVFTPSHEEEDEPETWGDYSLNGASLYKTTILSDFRTSRKPEDNFSSYSKSRRYSMGDMKSLSSFNKFSPDSSDGLTKNHRKSNIVVPFTDTHVSLHSKPRNKGLSFSWLFPKLKKKNKHETSPEEDFTQSQMVEVLKRELVEAHKGKNLALFEVSEMKSSLTELGQKLEHLESYCEELKKAFNVKKSLPVEKLLTNLHKRGKSTEEVTVDEFLQIVHEARQSVKRFCKALLGQVEENDVALVDNLNSILQPYSISLYSDSVLYYLEAIINQEIYQDFENCTFLKNGTPKLLDPQQDRQARFQSFVSLKSLSWNEVLRKGTKFYSAEFSKFCDQKMSGVIVTLGWTRPWSEELLQAFFVAAKCVWLVHLLAFSFNPSLGILRVNQNKSFNSQYMEDISLERQGLKGPRRVEIMSTPGFYVQDRVLRCKVLCKYK